MIQQGSYVNDWKRIRDAARKPSTSSDTSRHSSRRLQRRRRRAGANLPVQLIESGADLTEDVVPARCEAIHPGGFGPLGFCRTKPPAPGHARKHRIERARAQTIAVMVEFLQHPLTVDAAPIGRMMKNVDLPEGEQELTGDGITHSLAMISPRNRSRCSITYSNGLTARHNPTRSVR